jgi:POT family proton-dependent oligopeptide transporter
VNDAADFRLARTAAQPEWRGYPKGALLIIGVEFWERFSFYGMLSILALFLSASPHLGGFGWPAARTLKLVGAYSGAMYALPAFGGYLADRVLGRRRAVTLGASLMLIGQLLLASPVYGPEWLSWIHGAPLLQALHEMGVPLGQIGSSAALDAALELKGRLLDPRHGALWLRQAYQAASLGFYAAIGCLILGNALMKSTLVVLCGETMRPEDPRREVAYTYYYLGIAVGAMLSGVVVGTVADRLGWQYGFSVAAAGMTVALGSYVLLGPRWLGQIGLTPDRAEARKPSAAPASGPTASGSAVTAPTANGRGNVPPSPREGGRRIGLLLVLAALLCTFSVGWFQLFGSWLLFIDRDVDRALGAFVIPVPWFTSMNAAVVIVLAPLVAALWLYLGARNRRVDIVHKYVFALSTAALGNGLMALCARGAAPDALAGVWSPVVSLSLLAVGELVAWTATYGMVSRAAPAGYASVTMGAWYLLTLGLGGYLSGFAGALVDVHGFAVTFAWVAAAMAAAGVLAAALRGSLSRLAARARVML